MREQSLKPEGEHSQAVPIVVPKGRVPSIAHLDLSESPVRLQPLMNDFGDAGGGRRSVAEVPKSSVLKLHHPFSHVRGCLDEAFYFR
jgi:hypothetical protein